MPAVVQAAPWLICDETFMLATITPPADMATQVMIVGGASGFR